MGGVFSSCVVKESNPTRVRISYSFQLYCITDYYYDNYYYYIILGKNSLLR